MLDELRIQISSDIDYDHLIAEIYCNEKFFALVSQEEGIERATVEFHVAPDAVKKVGLEWLLVALKEAKTALAGQ